MENSFDELIKALKYNNTFQYPLESLKGGYLETLMVRLAEYIKRIEKFDNISLIYKNNNNLSIEKMSTDIIDIIKLHLSGKVEDAYKKFSIILNDNRIYIDELILHIEEEEEELYRVRFSQKDITDKKDIFHIPFSWNNEIFNCRSSLFIFWKYYL